VSLYHARTFFDLQTHHALSQSHHSPLVPIFYLKFHHTTWYSLFQIQYALSEDMKDSSTLDVVQPEENGEVREITAKEAQGFFGESPTRLTTIADHKPEGRKKTCYIGGIDPIT
jgi:hypothetical protein